MAKQPTIETLDVGYSEKYKLNKNFTAIASKFDEMLSRATPTDTPNFMEVDFDVADANITNVNRLEIESLQIVDTNFTQFSDYYIYLLSLLDCDEPGSMITHDVNGDPACLDVGANGQVLKTSSGYPTWSEDIDTDTVGVTVQEDGVTVAENVVNIDFKWTNVSYPTLVTTPASNQVDLALDDVYTSTITAIWEDIRATSDLNINPDGPSAVAFTGGAGEVVRLDLVSEAGVAIPTAHNTYYFIMETSSRLYSNSNPDNGSWTQGVRFYDNTGTSTPLTGTLISPPIGETAFITTTGAGGRLITIYCGIPANTRYIDVAKGDAFLFPLFVTTATVDNRYRAVVSAAAKNAGFLSPNDIAYPGGVNPSVTPA